MTNLDAEAVVDDVEKTLLASGVLAHRARLYAAVLRHNLTALLDEKDKEIEAARQAGRDEAVRYIEENFNDEYLEAASGLRADEEVSDDAEQGAFWMMWSKLLQEARSGRSTNPPKQA